MGTYFINSSHLALCGVATIRRALQGKIDLAIVDYGGYEYVGTWTQCERALRRDCNANNEPFARDCIGWASLADLWRILDVQE